jgi:polyisoprenoid-binding protein YceI
MGVLDVCNRFRCRRERFSSRRMVNRCSAVERHVRGEARARDLGRLLREFEGRLEVAPSGLAKGFGTANAASIDTGEPTRDEHLRRSADFFDVERCPRISFASTRINHLDSGRLRIVGDLTMRGVTREIELNAQAHGATRDVDGNQWIALELRGELSRREFGLTWNQALETGGVLLGDRVKIALDISAVRRVDAGPSGRDGGSAVQGD